MSDLKIIDFYDIRELNKYFSSGTLIRHGLSSIYSSYEYYNTKQEQICSIFINLINGHFFKDGNKRTSTVVLLSLAKLNYLRTKLTDKNLCDIIVKIASKSSTVKEAVQLVF